MGGFWIFVFLFETFAEFIFNRVYAQRIKFRIKARENKLKKIRSNFI